MPHARKLEDSDLLPDLFSESRWKRLVKQIGLTRRQAQVARLVCRGCRDKEIARQLGLTLHGIRRHVRELFERLEVGQRIGIVVRLVLLNQRENRKAH